MPMLEKMGFDTICTRCGKPKTWEEMHPQDDECLKCVEGEERAALDTKQFMRRFLTD